MEDNDVVDTVQKLRAKVRLQSSVDLFLHALVGQQVRTRAEANRCLAQVGRTEVRRHDQDRVLKVNGPALSVGQATIFQDLEQRIKDVGVRLLDLVKEHDGEGLATNGFGQLTALVVAHVSRR